MPLGEFELIERFFRRASPRDDVLLGVGDDAALLEVPPGQALVAATDTLVEGRHFLAGAPADSVGHQALAVNLSDLAAMGADPAWALLSLSLPDADADWLQRFAEGLFAVAGQHDVALVGGDTVRGPRVVTITALGFVPPALALRRDGARPGDVLYVSGWLGEAAAGLATLKSGAMAVSSDPLVHRYLFAEPRVALGRALRGRATAAMDISDGLLGDLGKLCATSGRLSSRDDTRTSNASTSRCAAATTTSCCSRCRPSARSSWKPSSQSRLRCAGSASSRPRRACAARAAAGSRQ